MSNFKSVKKYFFSNQSTFVVPYYQRGYKWSLLKNKKKNKLHLVVLFDDLITEFQASLYKGKISPNYEYYLQGVTVKERGIEIELVDGQQRTTSLFIVLCVLKNLGLLEPSYNLENKLLYKIRKSADATLQGFIRGVCEGNEKIQDIAALKSAWNLTINWIKNISEKELFVEFLLNHVKLIYIKLDEKQNEAEVFSMMNQDKAEMTQTDLIKSNILRESSRQLFNNIDGNTDEIGNEWQINQLRGKLATEWDNWRKWWENDKHSRFTDFLSIKSFDKETRQNEPLSALLKVYWDLKHYKPEDKTSESLTSNNLFEKFKSIIADKDDIKIEAIEVFEGLRNVQKSIEEWYSNSDIFNYLGLLFKGCGLEKKYEKTLELLNHYETGKPDFRKFLKKEYTIQMLNGEESSVLIKRLISENDVYHKEYTSVARHLLRMNVVRSNRQKQKFDFSFYEEESYDADKIENSDKRSLEHINPQTPKEALSDNEAQIELESLTNTIGNLVLLPKGLNSLLKNKNFNDKKKDVFDKIISDNRNYGLWFHTLDVFGRNADWKAIDIIKNKETFKNEFENFYFLK